MFKGLEEVSSVFPPIPFVMVVLNLFSRDCLQAQLVWNIISKPASISNSFTLDWQGWLHAHLNCKLITYKGIT